MATIDFTMMYAAHEAFRRDLRWLEEAVRAGHGGDPAVRAGWEIFQRQLTIHHQAEDAAIWPRLRRKVADRPKDLALLDAMEAEHARIDPLLDTVDAFLGAPGTDDVRDHLAGLAAALNAHLDHEERKALPLVAATLTEEDWKALAADVRRRQGLRGAAEFFPWVLDGATPERARQVMALLPAPVRLVYRLVWRPRYAPRRRWETAAA